ncbi:MAG: hypothetical protein M3Y41_06060 [Pseudomonadota bacterium]|nr:hypothetical protein [Pseudomonadota bacterium]
MDLKLSDNLFLIDSDIASGGVQVGMAEQLGRDVERQPAIDGFGRQQSAEIMRLEYDCGTILVAHAGRQAGVQQELPDGFAAEHTTLPFRAALEQVGKRGAGFALARVISRNAGNPW